jgi:hypothetical protein
MSICVFNPAGSPVPWFYINPAEADEQQKKEVEEVPCLRTQQRQPVVARVVCAASGYAIDASIRVVVAAVVALHLWHALRCEEPTGGTSGWNRNPAFGRSGSGTLFPIIPT